MYLILGAAMAKPNVSLVDVPIASQTLRAKNYQDAWTDYCILRLRQGKSPGCHMRDFCLWWEMAKEQG